VAKKRGNGEGSISKRKDGRYWGRYTVHMANGPKQKAVYGKTRAEVAQKLAKAMSDRDGGLVFDASTPKLGDYLDKWLPGVKGTVRQRTWERYEQIVRVHLKPALGRVKLKNLTATHLRALYNEKLNFGLASRTVNYIHTALRKALQDAVADGLVAKNVAACVKAPRPAKKEITPLSQEQARVFLDTAGKVGNRFEALYVVAVHCGLREGELLGLRWDDVCLDARKLHVRRSLSETRTGHKFEPPKNGKGRAVKLTQTASEALRAHRKRQNEERLAATTWEEGNTRFPSTKGTPMNSKNLYNRSFKPLLKRAGLPDIRFHDLRHTCATMRFKMG
jgi:integrase